MVEALVLGEFPFPWDGLALMNWVIPVAVHLSARLLFETIFWIATSIDSGGV